MRLSLTYKLFFTQLIAVGFAIIGMFLLIQHSFDSGFLGYVNTLEAERFEVLATNLETAYEENDDWEFLRNKYWLWGKYLADSRPVGSPAALRPSPIPEGHWPPRHFQPPMGKRPPHPKRPESVHLFEHRVILMDTTKNTLFGPPDHPQDMVIRDLMLEDETVGYLGLISQQYLTDDLQLRFVKEQKKTFGSIAVAMACLTAMLSLPLARKMRFAS